MQVKLVDAGFIWTEPHSRRLKTKLTVQSEVFNGAILQQTFVVEYVVETHMCPDCSRAAANPNTWTAVVQVSFQSVMAHAVLVQQFILHLVLCGLCSLLTNICCWCYGQWLRILLNGVCSMYIGCTSLCMVSLMHGVLNASCAASKARLPGVSVWWHGLNTC